MYQSYVSPIDSRYKSPFMSKIWSPNNKILTMRQLWVDLAQSQLELGVKEIKKEHIQEMTKHMEHIDHDKINEYESRFKHDIMAHIYAFGDLCPNAKKIIHLGATSNFINDNVDMILIKESLCNIIKLLFQTNKIIKQKAFEYINVPTLAYTHLQPAQLITVGKRFAMWGSDIIMDFNNIVSLIKKLPFRGVKGTVGSEDTLLKLFDGDTIKCDMLNAKLSEKYDFNNRVIVCGQTYSRKNDVDVIHSLSSLCQSIYKIMNDIRLLSGKSEIYEDFQKEQIGSSAMPYKMNPITCEKICSLSRLVMNYETDIVQTYINQWLERTLDDSAIKRIIIPDCFMLVEHILTEMNNCLQTLYINREQIDKNVEEHMPKILSEQIILCGVKLGYDRQDIHERLRVVFLHKKNFSEDEIIQKILDTYEISMDPNKYVGRCEHQVKAFYKSH